MQQGANTRRSVVGSKLTTATTRWIVAGLALAAGALGIWVSFLGAELHGRYNARNWSSTWVVLDLCEVAGLAATAWLVRRRSLTVAPIAAATATLIAMDAWFDVMTARAGSDWYIALALAIAIEIPLALGLGALSWTAPEWCE